MKKHKIWGIAILILLLGIAAVFIFLNDQTQNCSNLNKRLLNPDKLLEERNKQLAGTATEHRNTYVDADEQHPQTPHND